MPRSPDGSAELILGALADAHSPALTLAELQERSGLSNAIVHDQLNQLLNAGKVQISKDGHGIVWVTLCDQS